MRLTGYARGGGCACKIPPGELEAVLGTLRTSEHPSVLVGLDGGDDAAAVRFDGSGRALLSTVDFFTPVVDDARDWGRIAAANALSDIYAMGGSPVLAVNLLCWPRDRLPLELAAEVLAGGLEVTEEAGCPLLGGHSVDDPEPKYGLAVSGLAEAASMLRNNAGVAGLPISLSKPLGIGVLNSRHRATGEVFPDAIATMTQLNREAAAAALVAGVRCATDVTGFGLLGHLYKLARASDVTAFVDAAAVPYLAGARQSIAQGHVSGGTRRNLAWVDEQVGWSGRAAADENERLLLADAQTSGGLLVCGVIPGAPVIGELRPRGRHAIEVA